MAKRRSSCSKALAKNGGPSKDDFLKAQKGICALCGKHMKGNPNKFSFDHVDPHSKGGRVCGNVLLTHAKCNNSRGNEDPHPIYVEILHIVNAKLGWDDRIYRNSSNRPAFLKEKAVMDVFRRLKVNTRFLAQHVYLVTECRHNHGRVLKLMSRFFVNPRFVFEDKLKFMHDGVRF